MWEDFEEDDLWRLSSFEPPLIVIILSLDFFELSDDVLSDLSHLSFFRDDDEVVDDDER